MDKVLGHLGWIGPVALLIYMILATGLGKKIVQWAITPSPCKCGGTEFRLQPGWVPEMSYNNMFLKDMEGFPFPLPYECVRCGELKYL